AADHAGLDVREPPFVAQLGQERGVGREAQHREDVGAEKEVNRAQRFLKLGLRFSRNAAMPSRWSARPNCEWKSRRSKRMPSESGLSYARLMDSLSIITTGSEQPAILSATAIASSMSLSSGTTRDT